MKRGKYRSAKRGWYKLLNPEKFIKPIDEHMQSYKNGFIEYKSSLELKAYKYCDRNSDVVSFSIESFPIRYQKPSDNLIHRYYPDIFLEFKTGHKFIIEIKSKSETVPPKPPKKTTQKSIKRHREALLTYKINKAKWNAAKKFAEMNDMKFLIITEDQLIN